MEERELSPLMIVAWAQQVLFMKKEVQPTIEEIASYIRTDDRRLRMFLLRYGDKMKLKDIGLKFEVSADRVTQILYQFSHDLLLFYCREMSKER